MVRSVKIARELESWLFVTHNAQTHMNTDC